MHQVWKTVLRSALLLVVAASGSTRAFSQAVATADRSASISVFAGYSSVGTDYGTKRQTGYLVGADYTRYLHRFFVDPSFEFRVVASPMGDAVAENTFMIGPKLEHGFGRYHPYADFLIGIGNVTYNPAIGPQDLKDSSIAYSYGGGIDIDLLRNFSAKVDYQATSWPNLDGPLSPTVFSVGAVYHIPFHGRK